MQTALHQNTTISTIPLHLAMEPKSVVMPQIQAKQHINLETLVPTNRYGSVEKCPISPTDRHASGYTWRGVSLTRQDLLCLLIFVQRMDNRNTALVLGVSVDTVNKRSTSLRRRLGFENKQAMVVAIQEAGFFTIFPDDLIDSLFDELSQRKKARKI